MAPRIPAERAHPAALLCVSQRRPRARRAERRTPSEPPPNMPTLFAVRARAPPTLPRTTKRVGIFALLHLVQLPYRRARLPPPFSNRICRPSSTLGRTWTVQHAQVRGCAACCAARFALTRREGVTPPHAHRRKRYHFQGGGLGCLGRMGETRPFTGPRDTLCRHDHPVNGAYRRLAPTRPNLVY